MPTHYNRNKGRKKSGLNWDWERAAQGAISGAAAGSKGGPWTALAAAVVGGGAGGLTGRDEGADYTAFDEALDHYAGRSRKDARMLSDELSADLGANLASRGINNSRLGAGIVNANRGRVMGAAQGNIDKMRADMHARIAEAEYNASMAHDANTRQGWLDLARQLGMQAMMGDFNGLFGKGEEQPDIHPDDPFPELRNPDAYPDQLPPNFDPNAPASTHNPFSDVVSEVPEVTLPPDVIQGELINPDRYPAELPPNFNPNAPASGYDPFRDLRPVTDILPPDAADLPPNFDPTRPASEDDPFPELRRTGGADATMELDRQKKGATSVPPVKQDPWFAPRRDKLRESLSPEEMQVLEEVFPDGELDRILDPGAIMSDAPSQEPFDDRPIGVPGAPSQGSRVPGAPNYNPNPPPIPRREEGPPRPKMDVPPPSERSTLPDWAEDDGVINITPLDVDSEWATEEKMNGLPEYMGYIYDDEAGYNASDPSYAGIKQGTYTEWRERNRMYGAPKDVKDLAKNPEAIALFYQDYIQAAGVPHRFARTLALEYMYVDFAIHGGHAGARQILNDARQMLRAKGSTHPTDTELLTAFNRAKKDFYERQGTNANAFLERANRVYGRAMKMMGGIS